MLALYRCDRQADALQAYQDARGAARRRARDRARRAAARTRARDPRAGSRPGAAGDRRACGARRPRRWRRRPPRRLVTVVSAGLAERLDAESLHGRLDRYAAVVERHGGQIEGSVGDALVAVFGRTEVHEDDALRAVRAAIELRAEGARDARGRDRRGVRRTGPGRRARCSPSPPALERAAAAARSCSATASTTSCATPCRSSRPPDAWRLLALAGDGDRTHAGPFVNRVAELDGLRAAFARAGDERACRAITVIGPPGMGKSRLTREFLAEVGGEATVVVGRCPTYGEGSPTGRWPRSSPGSGAPTGCESCSTTTRPPRRSCSARSASPTARSSPRRPWAVRRLFERVAEPQPLVVVVEDVHWAQPPLLDLLEYLTAFVSGHPVLLVCLARPDLGELRPGWLAPRPDRGAAGARPAPGRRGAPPRRARRRGGRGDGGAHRRDGRGQPAVPPAARRGRRRRRRDAVAGQHPGRADRAARPAGSGRADAARGSLRPGPQLPRERARGPTRRRGSWRWCGRS